MSDSKARSRFPSLLQGQTLVSWPGQRLEEAAASMGGSRNRRKVQDGWRVEPTGRAVGMNVCILVEGEKHPDCLGGTGLQLCLEALSPTHAGIIHLDTLELLSRGIPLPSVSPILPTFSFHLDSLLFREAAESVNYEFPNVANIPHP